MKCMYIYIYKTRLNCLKCTLKIFSEELIHIDTDNEIWVKINKLRLWVGKKSCIGSKIWGERHQVLWTLKEK